ncbi:MAG: DNA polymerase III subunit gamma/tau [Firmicutes bacterium]|nr:DNA polymerase III subunit gamma/tau [Bacillota bacterium]
MPYTALYRQWRPQTFSDVIGQAHVTVTLQNALRSGKIGHAYLFAGPRGTGKTSVAKILARAVNCLDGPAQEPCNRCTSCTTILDGSATDVLEIDAASNRGIDEIRDLRSGVRFCPASLRYKVYIIDEVHMLTPEAFNALLKTLEEPPPHAIFILATTEPHRLPATVLSRCQRFGFHRISSKQVAERLENLARNAGLEVSGDALRLIAKASEGSLRDALGLLEQCAAYAGSEISVEHVRTILGDAGPEGLLELVRAVKDGDLTAILGGLDAMGAAGKDFRQLARDICQVYRDLLVLKVCRDPGNLVDQDPETIRSMNTIASGYPEEEVLRIVRALGEVESQMRYSANPRVGLEVGLLRIAGAGKAPSHPSAQSSAQAPAAPAPVAAQMGPVVSPTQPAPGAAPERAAREQVASLSAETAPDQATADVSSVWRPLMAYLRREKKAKIVALLEPAAPVGFKDGVLILAFRPDAQFHKTQMEAAANLRVLEAALKSLTGQDIRVRCTVQQGIQQDARHDAARGAQPGGKQGPEEVATPLPEANPPLRGDGGNENSETTLKAAAVGAVTPGEQAGDGHDDPEIAQVLEMFGGRIVDDLT